MKRIRLSQSGNRKLKKPEVEEIENLKRKSEVKNKSKI